MNQILSYIGYFILFGNTILYFKASFDKDTGFKIFSVYLLFMFIIQMISFYLWSNDMPNLFLSHFYFIVQFVFLSFFYLKLFKENPLKKIIKPIVFIVLFILAMQYAYKPSLFFKFNLLEINLTSLSLVVFSVLYFTISLNYRKTYFYVNSGIFIYLLSSSLIFSSGNLVRHLDKSVSKVLWIVNAFLYVFFQILILTEWYKNFRIKT